MLTVVRTVPQHASSLGSLPAITHRCGCFRRYHTVAYFMFNFHWFHCFFFPNLNVSSNQNNCCQKESVRVITLIYSYDCLFCCPYRSGRACVIQLKSSIHTQNQQIN
ncbi:hypothetical protein M0813_13872 [Anaeramoeba flamelloides]|uniref:Uncharacterized protein n=1 Tax=Anaeramoeba flamelloides TaxID=1746091 RepID=A0ABQ8Z811_9EUKA|nr:hypothetical protein M0813_13872 [Anaeramoeba flamelloides]